jgi:hypothetical protein
MWDFLLALLVLAAVAAALFWRPSDFVIRVRDGRVEFKGRLPRAHHGAITRFLLDDLKLQRGAKIMGTRAGRRLRLRFRGKMSQEDRQRVRNFLASLGL